RQVRLHDPALRAHDRHGVDYAAAGVTVLGWSRQRAAASHERLLRAEVERSKLTLGADSSAERSRYQAVSRDARSDSRSGSRTGSACFWPTLSAGALPSVRIRVTNRWPSEIRSISMAIASTACSSRSMRCADSGDS